MSPRDALKRITPALSTFQKGFSSLQRNLNDPQSKLEAIAAEIVAIPGDLSLEKSLFFVRTESRRDPAAAPRWFALSDATALFCGFILSWVFTTAVNFLFLDRNFSFLTIESIAGRFLPYGMLSLGLLIWFAHQGHYRMRQPFWTEAQQIVRAFGIALMIDGFLHFASKQDFSRLWLCFGWLFAGISLLFFRALTRSLLQHSGLWQVRTLLVGSGACADETRAALRAEPTLGYDVVMQVENVLLLLDQAGNSWKKLCDRFNADYVVISMDGKALTDAQAALELLSHEGIPYSISPPLRHLPVLGVEPQAFFSRDVMLLTPADNLDRPFSRFIKRNIDLAGALFGLLLLSPLFLIASALVKCDGGPVFFGDVRVGMHGRLFRCLKFRSMVVPADEILWRYLRENPEKMAEWNMYHKLREGDPRVTKVGAFLRKWSLDEVPQLLNVLKGDMSLVGPRPIMFREKKSYHRNLAHYCRVRPGLTGVWQVSGRSNLSFARRIQMDTWYIRNWSLWQDFAILCKTIPALLNKTGAY